MKPVKEKMSREYRIENGLDVDGKPKRRRIVTNDTAESWLIKQARVDPYYFMWYVTGMKPALHHKIWLSNYFHPDRRFINIIGARFSAKSHISVLSVLWLMSVNPYSTNIIISVSAEQAERRLSMLRTFIRENQRYRNVFPWIHIDDRVKNTQTEFTIYSDYDGMPYNIWKSTITTTGSHLDKNPSIKSLGVGGKGLIGSRFSGVVFLDDIVDKEDLSDAAQQKKLEHIKRDIIPCMTEHCRLWNIGTRWMIGDIYERLEANPAFTTITIPAIILDDRGNRHSYWPEEWPLKRIDEERIRMDDDVLFRVMYMCDPSATVAALFTREQLHRDLPTPMPKFDRIYLTTDFAISTTTKADYSVVYIVGVDSDRNVYLLDGIRFKEEDEITVDRVVNMYDMALAIYGFVTGVLIEHVGFQIIFQNLLLKKRPQMPTIPVRPIGDKMQRAKQVSYHAQQKRLYINQNILFFEQLESEWLNFDKHKYDDTLDPMGLLFQHIGYNDITARIIRVKSRLLL